MPWPVIRRRARLASPGQSERSPDVSGDGRAPPVCHRHAGPVIVDLPDALLKAAGDRTNHHGGSMDAPIGRDRFCEIFEGRAVVIAELPAGRSRVLAHVASQRVGRDDGSLRTRAEYLALFDLLLTHVSPATPAEPKLLDETGRPTAIARAIEDYISASAALAPEPPPESLASSQRAGLVAHATKILSRCQLRYLRAGC
jgi:hypothetical protein